MTWDWQFFLRDTGAGITYGQWLLSAWGWTVSVALLSLILALILGIIVGVIRTTTVKYLVLIGTVWTELFRNIPLLVQVVLWYHVVPALFPILKTVPSFLLVVVALGLYTSARISEQVRSGIGALPKGQSYAALALGLNSPQSYRHVILPVALRMVLPTLTSEAMGIVKNSSVAFAVSVAELTQYAMQVTEETSRGIEVYLAVTALYFISAYAINRVFAALEKAVAVPGLLGVKK